jgi:deoxyribodipyrimidine photo-lyase
MASVMWFRRDLRLFDNPALNAAISAAKDGGDGRVVPLFILDENLWGPSGEARRAYMSASLASLNESLAGNLVIRIGEPTKVISELAQNHEIDSVHIAADFAPYGMKRDDLVDKMLNKLNKKVELIRTGSPYAVDPGQVTKDDGTPYRVYSPFYRAWLLRGWHRPVETPTKGVNWWSPVKSEKLPVLAKEPQLATWAADAGEDAAWRRWADFKKKHLGEYGEDRNRPDLDSTSKLSVHLRWGEIHPRSLLAELNDSKSQEVFRKELAWREFYADVLFHTPNSVSVSMNPAWENIGWSFNKAEKAALLAWQEGKTGYPLVDAGMRQLIATGWMHNRVRMVVGSFLVKDLHVHWRYGAKWFMQKLRDGDLASNVHGWQWVAGCGTDAAPYFRVFNPVMQGLKFDPEGDYVRRWVPELSHLKGATAHEPWDAPNGYSHGYPKRLVDHSIEREETLRRYEASKKK